MAAAAAAQESAPAGSSPGLAVPSRQGELLARAGTPTWLRGARLAAQGAGPLPVSRPALGMSRPALGISRLQGSRRWESRMEISGRENRPVLLQLVTALTGVSCLPPESTTSQSRRELPRSLRNVSCSGFSSFHRAARCVPLRGAAHHDCI